MFIDYAKIHVKAGDGGHGCVAFRREKYEPKGGPAGGDGGKGGDIILKATRHMNTLLDFRYKKNYTARNGEHGKGARMTGKNGESCVIVVPIGTYARDESGRVLADLTRDDQQVVLVRGGKGGRGNARFATSTNQAPRHSEEGMPGEEKDIIIELKLIADVGLVGFPNAGKSTLLSRISAAKPKIADYPFTTLVPNLGIVKIDDFRTFVVTDIPGLIKDAHKGKGLGHQFLRHIERTRVLALLLDSSSKEIEYDYLTLLKELQSYSKELARKPRIVVVTKTDLQNTGQIETDLALFKHEKTLAISSVSGDGLEALLNTLWDVLNEH
ncbi:MAG: GTPase ObgE [candidate division KSB1 bacterium]|nr:GTPase ObgE [candidate division KSB1 bacterium]